LTFEDKRLKALASAFYFLCGVCLQGTRGQIKTQHLHKRL